MSPLNSPLSEELNEEVPALIDALHESGQRLEELTGGEVDGVADRDGRTFLLQSAQDHLRHRDAAILNALPAHIAFLDTQGLIISVNEAWRRFVCANAIQGPGYGVGINYLEMCDGALGDGSSEAHQAAEGIRSVLDGAVQSFSIEFPCHSPARQRWFLMTVTPLADDRRNGAVVMHLDVTKRRQTEESLRASELRFRQMAENIRDVFFLVDADSHRVLYVSPAYEQISGRTCESLYANPESWTEAFHPDDRASTYEKYQQGLSIGSFEYEHRIVRPDGSIRWMETRGFPVRNDAGRIVRIAGVAEDITDRKQAGQELRESERRFSDLLRNVELVSLMVDHEARITYCNEYLLRLTGWRHEEVIGRNWFELFIPPELEYLKGEFFAALLANQPETWHHENEILTRSGERRLIRWNNSVLRSGAGDVIGVAGIGEDITERKEAKDRIVHLNRVYAMLSGINTLIVRVKDRDELFQEACRIAVEAGGFRMSLICIANRSAMKIVPVASAGKDEGLLTSIKAVLSSSEGASTTMVARAIREKKAVVSNDSQNDPRVVFGGKYAESGVRSMAILPLIVSDEAVGTLALYASESEFFHDEEMKLLTELAGDISFALDHMDRQEKIDKLSRVRAVTSEINAAIVRSRSKNELFNEACRIAVEYGGFGIAWIGLYDPHARTVTPVAWGGTDDPEHIRNFVSDVRDEQSLGRGELIHAIREKTPIFSNDISADPDAGGLRRQEAVRRGYRSHIVLPLMTEGEVAAILALFTKEPDFFTEGEVTVLAEMASDISFALQSMVRQDKIEKLSRTRAVSSGINSTLIRVRDRQELFQESCTIAVEDGQFPFAWIGTLNPTTLDVIPVAWAGKSAEELTRPKSSARDDIQGGKGAVGQAIRERRPVFNDDIAAHSFGGPREKEILRLGFRSQATLPLFEDQTVVGTLTMYAGEPNFFDEDERKLLTELAGDISFALENISRQQKFDKLARMRALSSEINAAIIRINDREALLREACRIAVEHGRFELVWTGTIDTTKQQIQPVAWNGFSMGVAQKVSWKSTGRAGGTLAEAIRTLKPAVRNDIETELTGGGMRAEAIELGCRSTVCLPLVVDNNVAALIALFAPGAGFFDDEELALLNEVAADISFALQAIEKQKKLDYLSYYDVLTGLANRSLFLERVAQYLRSAASGGHKLALFLIDLERFKNINDSLGQPAGDALLRQVAEWLTRNAGDANLLARVGADHFAAVLPEVKQEGDVARLLEKMLEAFLVHPFRLNDAVFRVAAKVGIALSPDDGTDADALFKNAEAALKKAKARGDRYLFYTQKMTEAVAGKLTLENQLRQALEKNEFVLHYQPKVNIASGKLTGAEALIRWNDPRTGLVPPGQFIPILEETGLIYEVGRWALRKAIDDYLRWRSAGLPAVRIAVNVSPLQLRNRGFIDEIKQAIGIDAEASAGLELEITESLIMEDVKHSIASLHAIRAIGVCIAIDDFGTGFSSLSYLSRLPVDTLKIDRSFVIDMTAGPEGLAFVSTIINLAHSLKLKVVAEGVETDEQSRLLRLLDCDEMQGYLFSEPVPGEIFETRFLSPPPAG